MRCSCCIYAFIQTPTVLAQNATDLVAIPSTVPAALSNATYLGHHDPTLVLHVLVTLKLRNTSELDSFLNEVQNPASPLYHQFLTPEQFTAAYGPTLSEVNALVQYLSSQGIQVDHVSRNNTILDVREPSGVLESVFGVTINDYQYHGREVYGTTDSPKFPSQIAGYVQGVVGLTNIARYTPMYVQGPETSSSSPSGYSPQQIATAYNWPDITNTVNGSGETIAVLATEDSGLSSGDYDYFWSYYGLPSHNVSTVLVSSPLGSCYGCLVEATLDIERSGAMAPGASVIVYEAAQNTTADFTETYNAIADARAAQVVTISYGATESSFSSTDLKNQDNPFKQMAAEGMEVFVADGDGGSPNCESTSCDPTQNVPVYPASDPYVVATGGTTLTLNSNNTIANETAWSYGLNCGSGSYYCGTGGAISNVVINGTLFWPEPTWQTGTGVPQNGDRNYSDISLNADPSTGYSVYVNSAWQELGGTSFVAPELAGLFAVQASLASTPLGQANSAIYIDANNHYSTDFHDITAGNNGDFSAGAYWDNPTGWGSINAINLLTHVEGSSTLSPPTNLTAEYTQCINEHDKYFVSWQRGQVGNSTGFDAEIDVGGSGWVVFDYGPGPSANLTVPKSTSIGIRVRATNGSIWTSYTSIGFTSAPCSPPP